MKKYTLLGHVFELEDQAHHFLVRYIERIENYARDNSISPEVIDDIKYSIIEKLYRHETPITEKQVLEIANSLWEPEVMFDEDADPAAPKKFSRNNRRNFGAIDREKPLIRWVCYRLAKSLNIPVRIVRLLFVVLTLLHGTSIFLYIILALFVPYRDKKKTTGKIGSILFELVRIALRLFVIFMLLPLVGGTLFGSWILFFTPEIANQSFTQRVPQYMYVTAGAITVSLLALLIGAIGWLFKQRRLNKTLAFLAVIVVLIGAVITAWTAYRTFMIVSNTWTTIQQTQTFPAQAWSWIVTIDIGVVWKRNHDWSLHDIMEVDLKVVPASWTEIVVSVDTLMRWMWDANVQKAADVLIPVEITANETGLSLLSNERMFSESVPFTLMRRTITIAVPTNKEVVFADLDHTIELSRGNQYSEFVTGDSKNGRGRYRFWSCQNDILVYDQLDNRFRCKNIIRDDDYEYNQDTPSGDSAPDSMTGASSVGDM